MASLAPAPRTSHPTHPPPGPPAAPPTLWSSLPPELRRRIAREYADLMARMRTPRPPVTLETPHAERDASR